MSTDPPSPPHPLPIRLFFCFLIPMVSSPHSLIPPSPFSHTSSRTEVTDVPSKREGGRGPTDLHFPNLSGREKGKKGIYLCIGIQSCQTGRRSHLHYIGNVFFVSSPLDKERLNPFCVLCDISIELDRIFMAFLSAECALHNT